MFDNIKYGSYPRNYDSDDLPIEYKQSLFTKKSIHSLTDNIVEILKVSSIKRSLYNIIYKSIALNSDFYDLPFDGDERLIARRLIYRINDDIVFRLKNSLIVYV